MRSLAKAALTQFAKTPFAHWLLRHAATAPVALKSGLFYRVVAAVAARCPQEGLILTNMGLTDDLRVEIPHAKHHYVYGRAQDYLPERASVALAVCLSGRTTAFLDVGANEGLFSLAVGGDALHIFEPDPTLNARLQSNLALNGRRATVNRLALSDKVGNLVFYRNLDDDQSGSLNPMFAIKHRLEEIDTPVSTLRAYLAEHGLTDVGVKVDVEGAAEQVWRGADPERIKWMICEMIEPEIDINLPGTIIDAGYHAYYIRDFDLVSSTAGEWAGRHPFYNWLFWRDDPEALRLIVEPAGFRLTPSPSAAR